MIQRDTTPWWHGLHKSWLLLWILGVVTLGGAYRAFLYPRQQQLKSLKSEIRQLNNSLTQLQQAQTAHYQQQLTQVLEDQQNQCEQLLFSDRTLNRLDFRLRELANQYELHAFESRNVFEKTDKNILTLERVDQRQIVTLCEAEFPQFLRFLNALERNEPALFVYQLGLSYDFDEERKPGGQIELFALHEKERPTGGRGVTKDSPVR